MAAFRIHRIELGWLSRELRQHGNQSASANVIADQERWQIDDSDARERCAAQGITVVRIEIPTRLDRLPGSEVPGFRR